MNKKIGEMMTERIFLPDLPIEPMRKDGKRTVISECVLWIYLAVVVLRECVLNSACGTQKRIILDQIVVIKNKIECQRWKEEQEGNANQEYYLLA